ncbi:hypothetical protein FACS189427_05270 [Planctomycetales bacterium]|nr:hypothetical protein FACS189427_05270 [Planctomycetales bacterium]
MSLIKTVKSLLRRYFVPLFPKLYRYYSLYVHWKNNKVLLLDFDLLDNTANRTDEVFLPFDCPQCSSVSVCKDKLAYLYKSIGFTACIDVSDAAYKKAKRIYSLFAPQTVKGIDGAVIKKQRIGGERDGGYVMLALDYANQKDTVAYSFGVSDASPWDLKFAQYGIDTFQYDGTIEKPPQTHPNLHFNRFNIAGRSPKENERTVSQIISENGHQQKNIILQCDIEGAEWEMFEIMNEEEMNCFGQIIVEFHGLIDMNRFNYFVSVLDKINRTHQVYHIHANNCGSCVVLNKMILLPDVWEISYVRRKDYVFIPCTETFPTQLDAANFPNRPDIFLGKFA